MSKFKKLPQHELDGMSRKDLDDYFEAEDNNRLRDKFAMAAMSVDLGGSSVEAIAEMCFLLADAMMIERDK